MMLTSQPQPTLSAPVVWPSKSPALSAPVTAFPAAPNFEFLPSEFPLLAYLTSNVPNAISEGDQEKKGSKDDDLETKNKKKRGDLHLEKRLEDALLENQRLIRLLEWINPSSRQVSKSFTDFTYYEISEATGYFEHFIGQDDFGDTYKGRLCHTDVAIKVLNSHSLQGPLEFLQFLREVDTLSKMRHPNIATLIGVCEEPYALVYEYLPNGSLDDRLACKGNTPPLSRQTRIRIATELCSVLMFLHSCQPKNIIHGDLKPSNILLDASLSCKLSNLGIYQATHRADSIQTSAYMDPGELNPKSDVYSFGVILLRLLTGKPELGLIKEVQNAVDKGNLDAILDPLAGSWFPFVQAEQLALLGLRCCNLNWKMRPDLEDDVWRVLYPMKVSSSSSTLNTYLCCDEYDHAPNYFICPILQEVMQDPHIAADGFTYEKEALEGWMDTGHYTSPMTNLKLEDDDTLRPSLIALFALPYKSGDKNDVRHYRYFPLIDFLGYFFYTKLIWHITLFILDMLTDLFPLFASFDLIMVFKITP